MAVTGQMMILFVIVHLLGNTTIYFSNLNAYAAALHALPVLLWMIRLFMVAMLCLHIYFGIVVTLENKKAKPQSYAVTNHLSTTFAGRNMIWTGSLIGAFLVYHLLHFTFQVIDPAVSAIRQPGFPRPARCVDDGCTQFPGYGNCFPLYYIRGWSAAAPFPRDPELVPDLGIE